MPPKNVANALWRNIHMSLPTKNTWCIKPNEDKAGDIIKR